MKVFNLNRNVNKANSLIHDYTIFVNIINLYVNCVIQTQNQDFHGIFSPLG